MAHRTRRHSQRDLLIGCLLLIATSLTFLSHSGNAADAEKFTFADTPDNRRMLDRAAENYHQILGRHSRFAEVNGIRLHYLEFGDNRGLPLIWSHGYTSTAFEIVPVAQALVEAGYRVIAITYRRHGLTQVKDYEFSLYTIADDIATLMDELDLECAVVGGWSLGGSVSTAFYASYPDRVMGLALSDGGTVWGQARTERFAEQLKAMTAQELESLPPMPTRFDSKFEGFSTVVTMNMAGVPRPLDLDLATMFYSQLRREENGKWVFHIDHNSLMGSWDEVDDPAAGRKLKLLPRSQRSLLPEVIYRRLNVPLLLIDPTGDDTELTSSTPDNKRLAEQHPQWIRYIQYPDTPHMAHPSRPQWFVRDMKDLKARIVKTKSSHCRD